MSKASFIFSIMTIATGLTASCAARKLDKTGRPQPGSSLSSITMPIPPSLKDSVGPNKINAYSLSIVGGSCSSSGTGTTIVRSFASLAADETLANEKIRRSCDYVFTLTLGKADTTGTKLEKIYLTNDADGRRTNVTKEASASEKIQVAVSLYVTDDGKKDLGLGGTVVVPSTTEVDAVITPDIVPGTGGVDPTIPANDYDWRKDVQWATVPTTTFTGNDKGSEFYRDIMSHVSANLRQSGNGLSNEAHETQHMLVNAMRNLTSADDNFVYFEKGQGLYILRPKQVLASVRNYVGSKFKTESSRYDLYLVKSTSSWKDPLYMFDEWNAYVATTRTAVESKRSGKWDNENSDPVVGLIDFLYIGSTVVLTLKNLDPEYLAKNKQFKVAYALLAEESMKWSAEAYKVNEWKSSQGIKRMNYLRSDPENETIRAAVREFMGAAWTKRVLGF